MVTNNGVPAAVIVPVTAGVRERLAASGRVKLGTGFGRHRPSAADHAGPADQDVLDEDRGS